MAAPDHIGHQSGPPGLMGRSQACPIVTVKVLEEQHVVAPARVGLHPFDPAEARPAPVAIDEEDRHQSLPQIGGHRVERDGGARSRGVFRWSSRRRRTRGSAPARWQRGSSAGATPGRANSSSRRTSRWSTRRARSRCRRVYRRYRGRTDALGAPPTRNAARAVRGTRLGRKAFGTACGACRCPSPRRAAVACRHRPEVSPPRPSPPSRPAHGVADTRRTSCR